MVRSQPTSAPTREEVQQVAALYQRGAMREVCTAAQLLTQRYPAHPAGWTFLGTALEAMGHVRHALPALQRVVELVPQRAEHRTQLGSAYQALQQYEQSFECYQKALALEPANLDALMRMAQLHTECNRLPLAEESYRRVLEVDPLHALAYFQLAMLCTWQGRWRDAEDGLRKALAIKPDSALALDALGQALLEQGRSEEALACAGQALALEPDSTDLLSNFAFTRNYVPHLAVGEPGPELVRFGQLMSAAAGPSPIQWHCANRPERLRVGLVSGDFRKHAVSTFLKSVLNRAQHPRVEYFAYSANVADDFVTDELKPLFTQWRPITGLPAAEAAQRVADDAIHVLVDLSGHSNQNRLDVFALAPAPVRVSWLGYPATTGLQQMEYMLTAPHLSGPDDERNFSEKLWPLPQTLFCYSPPSPPVPVGESPAAVNGFVTFGSFNNMPKLTQSVVQTWALILQAVPQSRLYLRAWQMKDEAVQQSILARFFAFGVSAERLVLKGPIDSIAEHLAEYNRVDIALDPFPFGGGTTSAEAVYMGVPVVTLHGRGGLLRLGEGVAHAVGLQEWIAADESDYVRKAVAGAGRLGDLAHLRLNLRQRMEGTALLDGQLFSAGFEQALWDLWDRSPQAGP